MSRNLKVSAVLLGAFIGLVGLLLPSPAGDDDDDVPKIETAAPQASHSKSRNNVRDAGRVGREARTGR